jgi:hypothetical protein
MSSDVSVVAMNRAGFKSYMSHHPLVPRTGPCVRIKQSLNKLPKWLAIHTRRGNATALQRTEPMYKVYYETEK